MTDVVKKIAPDDTEIECLLTEHQGDRPTTFKEIKKRYPHLPGRRLRSVRSRVYTLYERMNESASSSEPLEPLHKPALACHGGGSVDILASLQQLLIASISRMRRMEFARKRSGKQHPRFDKLVTVHTSIINAVLKVQQAYPQAGNVERAERFGEKVITQARTDPTRRARMLRLFEEVSQRPRRNVTDSLAVSDDAEFDLSWARGPFSAGNAEAAMNDTATPIVQAFSGEVPKVVSKAKHRDSIDVLPDSAWRDYAW